MCDFTILVICLYNEKTEMTETNVNYVANKVVIVLLDVPIDCAYDQLLAMIYSMTNIDKERFKIVLTCKYPLKSIWDDNSVYRMLILVNIVGMEEIELYLQLVCIKPQVNQSIGTKDGNVTIYRRHFGCWAFPTRFLQTKVV